MYRLRVRIGLYCTGNVQRNDNDLPHELPLYGDSKIDFPLNTLAEAPKQVGGWTYPEALIVNQMYLSKKYGTRVPLAAMQCNAVRERKFTKLHFGDLLFRIEC